MNVPDGDGSKELKIFLSTNLQIGKGGEVNLFQKMKPKQKEKERFSDDE